MRQVDPADLVPFLAVAQHQSFRQAADKLGCTPSALSHAIRSLEERLELRLFNRTTRSVALTEAGERLYERVAPAFDDIHSALGDLDALRNKPSGRLRLNAARVSAKTAVLPLVARFVAAYPDVQVEIMADNALSDIVGAGFDAGIRFGETIAQDMIAVPIGGRQRSAVVAAPEFFAKHTVPQAPQDLKDLACIRLRFTTGRYYVWEFERGGIALNVDVTGPITVEDQDMMLTAALSGGGLAYLFEDQAKPYLEAGTLQRALEDWCPYYSGFYLYYPSHRRMPRALRAFVDFIKKPVR